MIRVFAEVLTASPELTAGITHLPCAPTFYPVAALLLGYRKAAFGIEASPHLVRIDKFLEVITFD